MTIRISSSEINTWMKKNKHNPENNYNTLIKENGIEILFHACGIKKSKFEKLKEIYGDKLEDIVHTNPFKFYSDNDTIDYNNTYKLWSRTTRNNRRENIISAALHSVMAKNESNGNSYIDRDNLISETIRLTGASRQSIEDIYKQVLNSSALIEFFYRNIKRVSLKKSYREEIHIARLISSRKKTITPPPSDSEIENVSNKLGLHQLDKDQTAAIKMAMRHNLSIITGGPGTGKTALIQIINELSHQLCEQTQSICLSLPAKIARAVNERTGLAASTIHKALEFNDGAFHRNRSHPLDEDLIFIEESFMIGNKLFKALLEAIKPTARLIIIGDPDQIEPIGTGKPAECLLQSKQIPKTVLTKNYRSGNGSTIPQTGKRIMQGRMPLKTPDISIIDTLTSAETLRHLLKIWQLETATHGINNVQILTAKHEGPCGTKSINNSITGRIHYAVGDRVMQLKNDHDLDIFNGETGTIASIKDNIITIVTDAGTVSEVDKRNLRNLTKAYCMSYHKSQGLEFSVSIIIADPQSAPMLSRNMLNVGVTRAKKKCYIINQNSQIQAALRKSSSALRKTMLVEFLNGHDPIRQAILKRISDNEIKTNSNILDSTQ